MMQQRINDLDYLAARIHGRKSRLAEAERLDRLCRIRNLSDFATTIFPDMEYRGITNLQRQLVYELAREISGFTPHLSGPRARLLDWIFVRFQVQNVKILFRAHITQTPMSEVRKHLVPLPETLTGSTHIPETTGTPAELAGALPKVRLRKIFEKALAIYSDNLRPFFVEAALDSGYFSELLLRTDQLNEEEREVIRPVANQEADIFHLMLAIRGKFHYGLTPDLLLPFHVRGTSISQARLITMFNDQEINTATGRALGYVIDELPLENRSDQIDGQTYAALVEALARKRLMRLANSAFRKSHMELGAVVGYIIMRLAETANLITISEGIRLNVIPEAIRGRMIPRV